MAVIYCCVDLEASGPVPGLYDMVSIGAVAVTRRTDGAHVVLSESPFYVEISPHGGAHDPGAMKVHGLTREHLEQHGVPLPDALKRLNAWADGQKQGAGDKLVFVGHNAAFDWSFVNHSYVRTGVPNPFGWKALDTKSLAMGVLGLEWLDTNKERLAEMLPGLGDQEAERVHRADYDALYQARILAGLLDWKR